MSPVRRVAFVLWLVVLAYLVTSAALGVISEVGRLHRADEQDRDPVVQALLAMVTLLFALGAVTYVIRALRGGGIAPLRRRAALLTCAALLSGIVWTLAVLAGGPH